MLKKLRNLIASFYELKHSFNLFNYAQTDLVVRTILLDKKYESNKRLNSFSRKAYSQFGEDGFLEEIFNRIGISSKYFVEFGVGNGLENNSCFLLVNGWTGLWIEGSTNSCQEIEDSFKRFISDKKLKIQQSFITAENIEDIFKKNNVPVDFDLLSIDIDGNDYHVWNAIKAFHPRVVVIEYNASVGPSKDFVVPYLPSRVWDGSNYFGTSLKSAELLGNKKGYSLVGCDLAGINAFFVRNDLLNDKFEAPFTSENHYEPPRYYLKYFGGHQPSVSN